MTDPAVGSHRVVTTAGHVDHGKSTLLRALTGMEPDRLDEERRRGLTLDLGFVWTDLGDQRIAFVDVPGHERFVGTMLAGVGATPAALLVVAADDGWSAQSAEHRDVLDLLDVPAVAVAVTKVDLVDADRVAAVVEEVAREVAGTSLAGAPIVEVDAVSGRGVEELGASVADRVAALPAATDVGRPRLWVDRSFAISGAGTVVTGTLVDGSLQVGDRARVLPAGQEVRIRGMQSLGEPVGSIGAGSRVALNLVGVSHQEVTRGDTVVGGAGPWRASREADLWVRTLEGQQLDRAGAWHLHVGTARTTCRALPTTGSIEPGSQGAVRVLLDHPLALVAGDRVVLREAGRRATVAGGRVVDPAPRHRPRGREERTAHAAAIAEAAAGVADADGVRRRGDGDGDRQHGGGDRPHGPGGAADRDPAPRGRGAAHGGGARCGGVAAGGDVARRRRGDRRPPRVERAAGRLERRGADARRRRPRPRSDHVRAGRSRRPGGDRRRVGGPPDLDGGAGPGRVRPRPRRTRGRGHGGGGGARHGAGARAGGRPVLAARRR
jgi:small GTP-binding protein